MRTTTLSDLHELGFTIRPAVMNDIEPYVEIINICSRAATGVNEPTPDRYRSEWQSPGFDIESDTRMVPTPENILVGCVEVWHDSSPPIHPWVWGRVHAIGKILVSEPR